MAAFLQMFLEKAGHDVHVESAGILEVAATGGPASTFSMTSAKRVGIDLSGHDKRWVSNINNLKGFDLFVCSDTKAAGYLLGKHGIPKSRLYNVDVRDPWPNEDQRDHDVTAETIMSMMYRVVARKFSAE
jgi:protein-tyrosine-phosphatase